MGGRLGLWDQDGTDFLADVVQAVANSQPDAVHTGGHAAKVPGETETGIPRHRYMAVLVAHVVARQTQEAVRWPPPRQDLRSARLPLSEWHLPQAPPVIRA